MMKIEDVTWSMIPVGDVVEHMMEIQPKAGALQQALCPPPPVFYCTRSLWEMLGNKIRVGARGLKVPLAAEAKEYLGLEFVRLYGPEEIVGATANVEILSELRKLWPEQAGPTGYEWNGTKYVRTEVKEASATMKTKYPERECTDCHELIEEGQRWCQECKARNERQYDADKKYPADLNRAHGQTLARALAGKSGKSELTGWNGKAKRAKPTTTVNRARKRMGGGTLKASGTFVRDLPLVGTQARATTRRTEKVTRIPTEFLMFMTRTGVAGQPRYWDDEFSRLMNARVWMKFDGLSDETVKDVLRISRAELAWLDNVITSPNTAESDELPNGYGMKFRVRIRHDWEDPPIIPRRWKRRFAADIIRRRKLAYKMGQVLPAKPPTVN